MWEQAGLVLVPEEARGAGVELQVVTWRLLAARCGLATKTSVHFRDFLAGLQSGTPLISLLS